MALELEHRWEHALIGATVEAAKQACPDCYLGRTAIQKLLYFMNVLGVPMRYSFDLHHYGPFCASVPQDVEWLQADAVIQDDARSAASYSNYNTGPNWGALKDQFKDKLQSQTQTIQNVVRALGQLDPHTLELIATLDFSFRWIRARGGQGPWKSDTVEKFKAIKKDKFSDQEINQGYAALVEANLIEP